MEERLAVPVSVRYWSDHCVHSRPFESVDEAVEFLAAGWRRHEFAPDLITASDGQVLASREDVLKLLKMAASSRKAALRSILARGATPKPRPLRR
jgi:hypothetical protein